MTQRPLALKHTMSKARCTQVYCLAYGHSKARDIRGNFSVTAKGFSQHKKENTFSFSVTQCVFKAQSR